jgi:tRNA A-37 threonylcarbamoyl transferase component Bud32
MMLGAARSRNIILCAAPPWSTLPGRNGSEAAERLGAAFGRSLTCPFRGRNRGVSEEPKKEETAAAERGGNLPSVLVLDSQSIVPAHTALDKLDVVLVAVTDLRKARHILLNTAVDVWVCDLAVPDLQFRILEEEARVRNHSLHVVLTGSSLYKTQAAKLMEEKRARCFVVKPWPVVAMRRAVVSALVPAEEPNAEGAPAPPATDRTHGLTLPGTRRSAPRRHDGRYRLDEKIGEGGTGRVYRAYDLFLEMEVAIKMLIPEFARDPEAIRALKQEARICLQLSHRHIVRLYNLELRRDIYLLIMEYVRGYSLHRLLAERGRLDAPLVAQIVAVIGDALAYAHGVGVLHKDLAPTNVLIGENGVLKLIDFGIADIINRQRKPGEFVIGTPVYMSPEQLRGETLDPRSDVYAFGVLVHQMLAGRTLHGADATIEGIAYQPHPPLDEALPPALRATLERATAFAVADRWPTVDAFRAALSEAFHAASGTPPHPAAGPA